MISHGITMVGMISRHHVKSCLRHDLTPQRPIMPRVDEHGSSTAGMISRHCHYTCISTAGMISRRGVKACLRYEFTPRREFMPLFWHLSICCRCCPLVAVVVVIIHLLPLLSSSIHPLLSKQQVIICQNQWIKWSTCVMVRSPFQINLVSTVNKFYASVFCQIKILNTCLLSHSHQDKKKGQHASSQWSIIECIVSECLT